MVVMWIFPISANDSMFQMSIGGRYLFVLSLPQVTRQVDKISSGRHPEQMAYPLKNSIILIEVYSIWDKQEAIRWQLLVHGELAPSQISVFVRHMGYS